jgi:hypothetical protein
MIKNDKIEFADAADLRAFNSEVVRYNAINAELNADRAAAIQAQYERIKSLGGQ